MVALFSALPTHAYSQYYNPWRHFPAPSPAPAQPEEPRVQADVLSRVSRDYADTAAFFQYLNVPAPKVRQIGTSPATSASHHDLRRQEYEFGWNRGSPAHHVSRYEQGRGHRQTCEPCLTTRPLWNHCWRRPRGLVTSYIACRSELRFRTRVKWGDQYGGYGEQYFEYNHGPQQADTGHQPTYNNYV